MLCYNITFLIEKRGTLMETQVAKPRRHRHIEKRAGALAAALCLAFGTQAAETSAEVADDPKTATSRSDDAVSAHAQPVELNPIVVTATRNTQRRDEVASSMEVVEGHVLNETVGN